MKRALIVILTACGGDDPAPDPDGPGPDPDGPLTVVDPLVGVGQVELVDGGYQFTEGPQWRETEQDLVFTDIPANTVFRYVPGGPAPTSFRMPSDMSNGLAIAADGAMFAAEHGSRSITRTVGNQTTTIADTFEGESLNSPNDLVFASDGTLYFTDPPFGISGNGDLGFMGVFRFAGNTLTAEHRGGLSERPNGIGISPDGTRLYVAYSNDGVLYRFAIGAGGALGTREIHATTAGTADGLAIDAAGNIFVTSADGVEVFAPDGSRWGTIEIPEQPSNCAFGEADHKTLYITARTSLYRVALANAGLPNN